MIKSKKKPLSKIFGESYTQYEKKSKRSSMSARQPQIDTETAFIGDMFQANYKGKGGLIHHKTCALDTENCKKIFEAVQEQVVSNQLHVQGV